MCGYDAYAVAVKACTMAMVWMTVGMLHTPPAFGNDALRFAIPVDIVFAIDSSGSMGPPPPRHVLFMQRLTLLLFSPSEDFQLMRAPSVASSGSNQCCSVTLPAIRPCWRTSDCASPGGATPARSAQ